MNPQESILPLSLFMDIERSGPIPLYFQISQRLEKAILDGNLPAGSRLENEVALSDRLGLSRPTVRRAIQELVDKGLLVRRRGIGTQVVHGQVTRGIELTSLYEDLLRSGKKPSTLLLGMNVIPANSKIAAALVLDEGAPTLHLRRLRLADNVAISVMENWLPTGLIDLTPEEIIEHGLYQVMRSRGVSMRVAKQRIGARNATIEEANLLNIGKSSALLTMDRTAYDSAGRAVEFGQHCYRPDLYSFEVTLVEK